MKQKNLTPWFPELKKPTHVWYANKPPLLGGTPEKLSIAEFNNVIGQAYSYEENIFQDAAVNLMPSGIQGQVYMRKQVEQLLKAGCNEKLVVCQMDHDVGCGVFAREAIALGEMLAIYSGEVAASTDEHDSTYSMDLDTSTRSGSHHVNAKYRGGLARFF